MTSTDLEVLFNSSRIAYTKVTPQVWGPTGQALAFQLQLRPGEAVLDICSGAGASALSAAAAVGPSGQVHAIDLADDLLEEGRLIASDRALQNIQFVHADATRWEPPSSVPAAGYDALSSAYGVSFLPHMDTSFARLTRLVRPGGRIGVAMWRKNSCADFTRTYFGVLERHRPDQPTRAVTDAKQASERINGIDTLTAWLGSFGTYDVEVTELSNFVPVTEDFAWNFVLGSTLRAPLDAFDADTVAAIRAEFADELVQQGVHNLDAGTLIGTAVVRG